MNEFEIKFEFFGKYLKTKVVAENEIQAIKIVRDRINIIEVNKVNTKFEDSDLFQFLQNPSGYGKK